jgi:hypothetical protein
VARCAFCGRPGGPGELGWHDLDPTLSRCPSCGRDAVDTPERLRAHVPAVRQATQDLGFGLASRVRVVFATATELRAEPRRTHGQALGLTELRPTGGRSAEATVIRVLRGLPAFMFGRVVAHEVGHAWLGQFGAQPCGDAVREGVCELLSYAWLKRSAVPFAEAVRDGIRTNPDPVYGDGFRTVHAAVRRHGRAAVVTSLAATGELPTDPSVKRTRVSP